MKHAAADSGKVTKRRISWAELYKIRPDLRPDNDNANANAKDTDAAAA
jgi:hypothetical protein